MFVRVFAFALMGVLSRFVNPSKNVNIVRLPLNATTPRDLRRVLRIRGITDWSVERILEQTIAREGIAVFHLEENPEDPNLQLKLFSLVEEVVGQLVMRYPERRGNLVYILTSNYAPHPTIKKAAFVVATKAPTSEHQRQWCVQCLEKCVKEHTGVDVEVDLQVAPKYTADMRKVEKWWHSIGFALSTHITAKVEASLGDYVGIKIDGSPRKLVAKFTTSDVEAYNPPVTLVSHDGYFFVSSSFISKEWGDSGLPDLDLAKLCELETVLQMLKTDFVKPAVILLTGKKEILKNRVISFVSVECRRVLGQSVESTKGKKQQELREMKIKAYSEDDKRGLFGDPDPSSGPLYRFMNSINSPIYESKDRKLFGLVVANVNMWGQFMLRELLEVGDSRTHITRVRKDRICFIVCIEGEVSPQAHSRSHIIINCDETPFHSTNHM